MRASRSLPDCPIPAVGRVGCHGVGPGPCPGRTAARDPPSTTASYIQALKGQVRTEQVSPRPHFSEATCTSTRLLLALSKKLQGPSRLRVPPSIAQPPTWLSSSSTSRAVKLLQRLGMVQDLAMPLEIAKIAPPDLVRPSGEPKSQGALHVPIAPALPDKDLQQALVGGSGPADHLQVGLCDRHRPSSGKWTGFFAGASLNSINSIYVESRGLRLMRPTADQTTIKMIGPVQPRQ